MKPYPISYRSLVPKQTSAKICSCRFAWRFAHRLWIDSHGTGVYDSRESSATAAAMAIDEKNSRARKVDYAKLRARLLADKQVLDWPGSARAEAASMKLKGIVLERHRRGKNWRVDFIERRPRQGRASATSMIGNAHKGEMKVVFRLKVPTTDEYQINLISTPNPNRASNVRVTVSIAGDAKLAKVNQRNGNGIASLGTFQLAAGKDRR